MVKRPSPVEIYRESDIVTRTIRDVVHQRHQTIWVDEPNAYNQAAEFLRIVMPRFADRIKQYTDTEPLFHRFRVEDETAPPTAEEGPPAGRRLDRHRADGSRWSRST